MHIEKQAFMVYNSLQERGILMFPLSLYNKYNKALLYAKIFTGTASRNDLFVGIVNSVIDSSQVFNYPQREYIKALSSLLNHS